MIPIKFPCIIDVPLLQNYNVQQKLHSEINTNTSNIEVFIIKIAIILYKIIVKLTVYYYPITN